MRYLCAVSKVFYVFSRTGVGTGVVFGGEGAWRRPAASAVYRGAASAAWSWASGRMWTLRRVGGLEATNKCIERRESACSEGRRSSRMRPGKGAERLRRGAAAGPTA